MGLNVLRCSADILGTNTYVTCRGWYLSVGACFLPAYSPSMSPPVKQGRDGEQDSTDGSIQHESERSVCARFLSVSSACVCVCVFVHMYVSVWVCMC